MFVAGDNNTYKVIQECANEDGTQKWFLLELDEITELKECLRVGAIQLRLARSVLLEIESKKKRNVFRRIIDAIKNESIPTWQTHS